MRIGMDPDLDHIHLSAIVKKHKILIDTPDNW